MLVELRCLKKLCTYKVSSRVIHTSAPTLASNMHWSANALSALTSDTEPTIVLEFDSAKYIFNVGENTIRTFVQSRQNFKKTRGLFLTSVGSQRAGGLAGEWLLTCRHEGIVTNFYRYSYDIGGLEPTPCGCYWS